MDVLVAATVGAVSGYYIWKPVLEERRRAFGLDPPLQKTPDANVGGSWAPGSSVSSPASSPDAPKKDA